ncbi:hypothetical protein [Rhodococcus jostii]|uniref:hypothetical protein n=1 Tax=Rhodococcus jostii TaxID=132919 RepID=UPI003645C157
MTITIVIDPNLRVGDNNTLAGFDDVIEGSSDLVAGLHVGVLEPESGLFGDARIVRIDHGKKLVELAVDWKLLHV